MLYGDDSNKYKTRYQVMICCVALTVPICNCAMTVVYNSLMSRDEAHGEKVVLVDRLYRLLLYDGLWCVRARPEESLDL
jgi:hypothetical protein